MSKVENQKTEYIEEMGNVQEMSVNEFVEMMLETYTACVQKGISVGNIQMPAFLWGGTGIGKSDGIREFAEKLEHRTGKSVQVIDIRLATQSPMDMKGLLLPSADRKSSEYVPLNTYQFANGDDKIYILFYDELTSAPPAIQSIAYEIIRDRKIDQNKFPDNVIILAAGNRVSDKGLVYRMLRPLANRFEHYQITTTFSQWKVWAQENQIHPLVVDYLTNFPNKLNKEEVHVNDLAFPTPRAWGNVSFNMKLLYEPVQEYTAVLQKKIAGTIGVMEERAFYHWLMVGKKLPALEDILQGTCRQYPKEMDVAHAVIRTLLSYVKEQHTSQKNQGQNGISWSVLENICNYINHFPKDFVTLFFTHLRSIDGIEKSLMNISVFRQWMMKN